MTKSLKNKLLLALTALLTVILTIFGVSIATPLQSAKADTFSCDHKENLVVLSNGEDVRGKTLRIGGITKGSGTTFLVFSDHSFDVDIMLLDSGVLVTSSQTESLGDYFTYSFCETGAHVDITILSTASFVVSGSNIFESVNYTCDTPVYVVSEEEPGTDTEQPEQKPTDTTNWYKHEYTSGANIQGQYVRFERTNGHDSFFLIYVTNNSAQLHYKDNEFSATLNNKMTGEAVVLRATDTVVDVFFSSDFAINGMNYLNAEVTLEKQGISIFFLSQDGTIENNPSIPVVPDNPNTDGSSDEKPDNTDEKDLLDNVRDWLDGASEWINENTGAQLSSGALLVIAVVAVVIVLSKKR